MPPARLEVIAEGSSGAFTAVWGTGQATPAEPAVTCRVTTWLEEDSAYALCAASPRGRRSPPG
jgi:hypothetical protein